MSKVKNNTVRILYDANDEPVGFTVNDTASYYYVKNLQGDVLAIVDKTGAEKVSYVYDAWGRIVTATGDATLRKLNPCTYRGYSYDAETGLYYLQSRYYNPEWGRFINADRFDVFDEGKSGVQAGNLFAYCINNPVNNDDKDGNIVFSTATLVLIGAIIGAITSAVLSLLFQKAMNPRISAKKLWSGVLIDALGGAVSGAFAVLPCGTLVQAIVNSIIGGVSYVATCRVQKTRINKRDLTSAFLAGAAGGVLGGKGLLKNVKKTVNVSDVMGYMNRKISREARRKNRKYAAKLINTTKKRFVNVLANAAWKSMIRYTGSNIASKTASSIKFR